MEIGSERTRTNLRASEFQKISGGGGGGGMPPDPSSKCGLKPAARNALRTHISHVLQASPLAQKHLPTLLSLFRWYRDCYTGAPEAVRHWSGKYTEAAKQLSNLPCKARKFF